jgi:hypothetical protein
MQNIIRKAVRPIESEAYEILRAIQAYEYILIYRCSKEFFNRIGRK